MQASQLSSKAYTGSVRPFQASRVSTTRVSRVATPTIENRVVIRFARFGRRKAPFFRIVAVDSKTRRDGAPLEYLGWYDPMKKETNLNAPAIKKWLEEGAQPSETVENLLKRAFVMTPDAPKVVVPKVTL